MEEKAHNPTTYLPQQSSTSKPLTLHISDQQYQQVDLYEDDAMFEIEPKPESPMLTPKEETQLLLSLKLPTQTENLLDLTCEETEDQTSRTYQVSSPPELQYQEIMEGRVAEISGPLTVQDGMVTSYKLYRIRTRKADSQEFDTFVERRYSDFQYLNDMLVRNYGGYLLPVLPQKNILTTLNMETNNYMTKRKVKLQRYLDRLLAHHKLRYTKQVVSFILDPDNSFSEQKGEYYGNQSLEESIYNITSHTLSATLDLLTQYLPSSVTNAFVFQNARGSTISTAELIESQQKNSGLVQISVSAKDKQELVCFEIMVNKLTDVVVELGPIVTNTCQEQAIYAQINQICNNLSSENHVFTSSDPEEPTPSLMQNYEQLLEQIESCKQALDRHQRLSQELYWLMKQLSTQSESLRTNPRNIKIDILRSKIQSAGKKYEETTQQLIQELRRYVDEGKVMVGFFITKLVAIRAEIYNRPIDEYPAIDEKEKVQKNIGKGTTERN